MEDYMLRREQKESSFDKVKALGKNMGVALSNLSKTNEGKLVLRYILRESCFLAPLMPETPEGVNKDIMVASEAKRRLYLALRAHMDRETIMRVELPEKEPTIEGGDQCQILS
jgi:hypothetical protein